MTMGSPAAMNNEASPTCCTFSVPAQVCVPPGRPEPPPGQGGRPGSLCSRPASIPGEYVSFLLNFIPPFRF